VIDKGAGVHSKRLFWMLAISAGLVVAGTVGYYVLEQEYSLFDALYMTVTTLTTVGYGETHPLHTRGRVFTILLLLGGVITFFFTTTEIIRWIISGEMQELIGRRRMERSLAGLQNHLIICGFGRMGRSVCQQFSRRNLPFVIIDRDPELLHDFEMAHGIALPGDATSDELLKKAGVERAKALITVTADDSDNLFITMSARLLNAKLFIVARAEGEPAEHKLMRAGANRVVSPYALSGFKMAQAVLQPNVVDFLELATQTEHLDLQIEETVIDAGSRLAGQTLRDSRLRFDLGIIVVAIKKTSGHLVSNPQGDAVMEVGDTLIAIGHRQQLDQLEKIACNNAIP
jgi:voltage-gated potassium channel